MSVEIWLEPIDVSSGAGSDVQSQVVQLADGRIMVVWTQDADSVAANGDREVFAQLYDQLGNPEGTAFQLNTNLNIDDEELPSIDALPDGGWIVTYTDNDDSNTNRSDVFYQRYDSAGTAVSAAYVGSDSDTASVAGDAYGSQFVVSSDGSTGFFVWLEEDLADGTNTVLRGRTIDLSNNTLGTEFTVYDFGSDVLDFHLTARADNTFGVGASVSGGGDDFTLLRVYNTSGTLTVSSNVAPSTNGEEDTDIATADLTSGQTVAVWTARTGVGINASYSIEVEVLSSTLSTDVAQFSIATGGFLSAVFNPRVVSLSDGTFVVSYERAGFIGSDTTVFTQFDSAGNQIGDSFSLIDGSVFDFDITALADGRIAVSYSRNDGDSDVRLAIVDPRDSGSEGVGAFIGTQGDDTEIENFGGANGDIFLVGGDDSLQISAVALGETFDGGEGFDTLRLDGSSLDHTVDLSTNTFEDSDGDTDTILNFEQVITGGGADTLTGVNLGNYWTTATGSNAENANFLRAGAGDDTVNANGADGEFEGGDGADTLTGSNRTFSYLSYAGSDGAVSVNLDTQTAAGAHAAGDVLSNWNAVRGSDFDDVLTGNGSNNALEGGAGADTLDGGGGTDFATYFTASAGVRADLRGILAGTGDAAGDTFTSIEALMGSLFSDQLYSEGGFLYGNRGDDFLFGTDSTQFYGGDGYDRVTLLASSTGGENIDLGSRNVELVRGTNFDDTLNASGVTAEDLVDQNGNVQPIRLFGLNGNDTLTGSDFADIIYGDLGNDTITGSLGDDFLYGRQGNDSIDGGDGEDRVDGSTGADTLIAGAGDDILIVDDLDVTIDGGAGYDRLFVTGYAGNGVYDLGAGGIEFANGNGANDTFEASTATWDLLIKGQGGNDIISGGSGADRLFGGNGADAISGGSGDDTLNGGAGVDSLDGGAGDDRFFVTSGDSVSGGAGYDRVYVQGSGGFSLDMTAAGVEFANGQSGADVFDATNASFDVKVFGRGGSDSISGGFGADLLYGGTGNDTLEGNQGDDRLYGDGGADTFVYGATGWGDDIIQGFEDGVDKIDMTGLGIAFGDLTITSLGGANTLVEYAGSSIELRGISIADLDAGDFMF